MDTIAEPAFRLPPGAHIGGIHIRVSNLARAVHFYGDLVGFRVLDSRNGAATLAGSCEHETQLSLTESPGAKSRAGRSAGLFHVAFRYAGRKELATALMRFLKNGYPIGGAADHLVSDAIYLEDPDGNGVELYWDHPRATWPRHGDEIAMSTEPLDVQALLTEAAGPKGGEGDKVSERVEIGHVHLQVTDLARAEQFYHGMLGLDVTQRTFPGALFLSAGGYHHHVGLNTWSTRGGAPGDENSLGMISFEIRTGDQASLKLLRTRLEASKSIGESAKNRVSPTSLEVFDPDRIGVRVAF